MADLELLQCYNRGCGEKFNPKENKADSCKYHPGEPIFHDAYKGWSCCNKKSTDFTEFLNFKGCTHSFHSNVKPEIEKPTQKEIDLPEVVEVKPIVRSSLPRPPFDTPLTVMKPELAPSLKQVNQEIDVKESVTDEILIGTSCKNGGCKSTYEGPEGNKTKCIYHSGCPVFHEGLKYWSCCTKRTTDFQAFLDQVGCQVGTHLWKKEKEDKSTVHCRWDHHQTASHVIVSIYAKQYDVKQSVVKLNPIRLYANLVFPRESGSFLLDIELKGIVDVDKSKVTMFGTKLEISLKKAEPGSWSLLHINRKSGTEEEKQKKVEDKEIISGVNAVDLSEL